MTDPAILLLDGEWQLFHFPEGKYLVTNPADMLALEIKPIPALVPGNVELDLQRAGQTPEPFFGDNILKLRKMENHEWWYFRRITIPPEFQGQECDLIFEGLDTIATVWVNNILVGQGKNMLIEHRFDVSEAIQPGGTNTIAVRLGSVVNQAKHFSYESGTLSWEHRYEGLYIRKAPHTWGWDIMPRAVSAGIWKSVRLQTHLQHEIEQIYYWTSEINREGAVLGVRFQIRSNLEEVESLSLRLTGTCQDHRFQYDWPLEFTSDGFRLPIQNAKLWWPRGYGEPNLYTIQAQLIQADQVLSERVDRIGIRKILVDRTEKISQYQSVEWLPYDSGRVDRPPSLDSRFVISVNDIPILIKGTNWVPLDAFHSRDASRLTNALAMVAELNCNMIRCWGGNVYESDSFYNWCDTQGVLIWQDFSFACCIYPQDDDFVEQVQKEVTQVAKSLRNHPSLAIWCGDNEIDMVYVAEGRQPKYNRLTRQAIPQILQSHDPHRHYIPSSPYVPDELATHPDGWQLTPEQHLWGPRGYFKSSFYTKHSAHFIGEIGYHGCPNVSSIKKFISPEKHWPWQSNQEWQAHSVYHWRTQVIERDRIQLMANQIKEFFGIIPDNLNDFVLASQITQAEAKKFFIESTRLRKWSTSGILWWNLLDGWPQFSDAVVDYYFGKKLAYYYIWRIQQPVCGMIGESETGKYIPLIFGNDSNNEEEVLYRVWDADSGESIVEGTLLIPANENWQADRIRTFASEKRLYIIEWKTGKNTFGNHYLVGTPPFSFEGYKNWLRAIAALPKSFEVGQIAQ